MQFKFSAEPLEKLKTDIIIVLCQQKVKDKSDKGAAVLQKSDGGTALDRFLGGLLSNVIKDEGFKGEVGTYKLVHTGGQTQARAVLLIGIGKLKEFTLDTMRKIGGKLATVTNEIKARSVAGIIQNESVRGFRPPERIQALTEGIILGGYKFKRYKDKKEIEPDTLKEVIFCQQVQPFDKAQGKQGQQRLEEAIGKGALVAEGVNLVRDLVNLPSRDKTPDELAKKVKEIALKGHLKCEVWGPKEIAEAKMGCLLSVSRGSENEPRFIQMSYKPQKKARAKVALVGKGVTFDTGGYDLKPANHMQNMKGDMGGAAVCIGLMKIISAIKPPIEVDAYIPATENMIGPKAEIPGSIVKARNGKTVEVISTDAEGRMIMADAISYAAEKEPDMIIDIATLTGHVLYALGEIYTAVLGNNQPLIDKFLSASKEEGEPAWQLPLEQEYKKGFKDGPADLKNIGKTKAGTIAGALFLEEFVGDTKWFHLDIAESHWTDEDRDYTPKGGTGATVRTLVRFLASYPVSYV